MLSDLPVLKAEFLVTRRCQLRCNYCKISRDPKLWGEEMTTEQALSCVDLMADNWPGAPMIIYGGEPTMRDDLPDIIQHMVKRDVKHAVISNSIRILEDESYAEELVGAGLSNWSISYDGDSEDLVVGWHARKKSMYGIDTLRVMRDQYGIEDLVACITVTKKNIEMLPSMVVNLTSEGIWAICTPLQFGGIGYEYSKGKVIDLPSQEQLDIISPILEEMAVSGKFLMHNGPEWFREWPLTFRKQDWKCHDKSVLTIDADGCLRYCVDISLLVPIRAWQLREEVFLEQYRRLLKLDTPCLGCFWDPCYEGTHRALSEDYGIEKGRESFRHEMTEERISKLLPEAQKWFRR
jgi:MoaA/NifB/PqqE/SkfB family radical SAM enzyme